MATLPAERPHPTRKMRLTSMRMAKTKRMMLPTSQPHSAKASGRESTTDPTAVIVNDSVEVATAPGAVGRRGGCSVSVSKTRCASVGRRLTAFKVVCFQHRGREARAKVEVGAGPARKTPKTRVKMRMRRMGGGDIPRTVPSAGGRPVGGENWQLEKCLNVPIKTQTPKRGFPRASPDSFGGGGK